MGNLLVLLNGGWWWLNGGWFECGALEFSVACVMVLGDGNDSRWLGYGCLIMGILVGWLNKHKILDLEMLQWNLAPHSNHTSVLIFFFTFIL